MRRGLQLSLSSARSHKNHELNILLSALPQSTRSRGAPRDQQEPAMAEEERPRIERRADPSRGPNRDEDLLPRPEPPGGRRSAATFRRAACSSNRRRRWRWEPRSASTSTSRPAAPGGARRRSRGLEPTGDDEQKRPGGFGVKFVQLDPRFRGLIYRVVDRFIQGGGDPFDLEFEAEPR